MKTFAALLALLAVAAIAQAAGTSVQGLKGRQLLQNAPPPHHHHHASPPGHHDKGFLYSEKDGPLAFTITAKNSTGEAKNHNDGKDTSQSECVIQGAEPKAKDPDEFKKGPLNVVVPVNQKSTITLNARSGIVYKNANITGSTNVTTIGGSVAYPSSLVFAPNYHTEHAAVKVGVFGTYSPTQSCTLTVRFHALHKDAHQDKGNHKGNAKDGHKND